MHYFDYTKEFLDNNVLDDKIKQKVNKIMELNTKFNTLFDKLPQTLRETLASFQAMLSSYASNRQEHVVIFTTDYFPLFHEHLRPLDFSYHQILGLYQTLNKIQTNQYKSTFSKSLLLNLHYDLMNAQEFGGQFKNNNNFLWNSATREIVFMPPSKYEAPYYILNMCESFAYALQQNYSKNPIYYLPLVFMLAVDMVVIHPFDDGNGRTQRLLIDYLLHQYGLKIHQFISLENLVFLNPTSYYASLQIVNQKWYESADYKNPFINYYLELLINAYETSLTLMSNSIFNTAKNISFLTKIVNNDQAKIKSKDLVDENLTNDDVMVLSNLYAQAHFISFENNIICKFSDFRNFTKKRYK